MQKVLIKTGYSCNNECIICHSNKLRNIHKDSSLKQIRAKILSAKKKGYRFVLFSGGEPTIRKDFLQIAKFVKKQDMVFGLITNGRMLSYSDFLKKLVNLNLKYVYISLLGGEAKIHNKIANTNSFNNTFEGIRNVLKEPSIEYLINITVIKSNMNDLKNIVNLLSSIGAKRIKFSFIDYKGKIKNNYIKEIPRISEAAERVKEAIDYALEKEMEAFFDGFPSCLMIGYQTRLNNLFTNKIVLMSEAYESEFFEIDNLNRLKPEICNSCEFYKNCVGLEKGYLELFGTNELRPLKKISNSAPFFLNNKFFLSNSKNLSNDWRKIFVKNRDYFLEYIYESSDFNKEDILKMIKKGQVYLFKDKKVDSILEKQKRIASNIFVSYEKDISLNFHDLLKSELKILRGNILEVGCGEIQYRDLFDSMIKNNQIDYTGLDPLIVKSKLEKFKIIQSSLENYAAKENSYDHILLLGSYNHLLDLSLSFKKIKKYLKPNGFCIISEDEPKIILKQERGASYKEKGFEHYRNGSLKEVKIKLKKLDFQIIKEIPSTKNTLNFWAIIAKNIKE